MRFANVEGELIAGDAGIEILNRNRAVGKIQDATFGWKDLCGHCGQRVVQPVIGELQELDQFV